MNRVKEFASHGDVTAMPCGCKAIGKDKMAHKGIKAWFKKTAIKIKPYLKKFAKNAGKFFDAMAEANTGGAAKYGVGAVNAVMTARAQEAALKKKLANNR